MFEDRPARPHGVRTPGELTAAIASRSEHLWFPARPGSRVTAASSVAAGATGGVTRATKAPRSAPAGSEMRRVRCIGRRILW